MPNIEVADFDLTERTEDKMWVHGVVVDQLYEVIAREYVVVRNRPNHPAPYVLIGRDAQGRCLTIPIAPTDDRYIWRPITAWTCKPREAAKLRQRRQLMEEPTTFNVTQDPLDDEEREVMDSETWDWSSVEPGVPSPQAGAILRIRFTRQEISRLQAMARAEGMSSHEFVRQSALSRMEQLTS